MKKVGFETVVTCAVAALLAGCGGDDERTASEVATPVPTAAVTVTPSETPAPSPEATPGATATATPNTGGAEAGEMAGDEEGIRVPVDVTIGDEEIRASTQEVAAFLPLRFTVFSKADRELQVVVAYAGGPVARLTVPAGGRASEDVPGLKPGTIEILSPDLGPSASATVRVEPGGG